MTFRALGVRQLLSRGYDTFPEEPIAGAGGAREVGVDVFCTSVP